MKRRPATYEDLLQLPPERWRRSGPVEIARPPTAPNVAFFDVRPDWVSEDEKEVRAEPFEEIEIDASRWWILPPPSESR